MRALLEETGHLAIFLPEVIGMTQYGYLASVEFAGRGQCFLEVGLLDHSPAVCPGLVFPTEGIESDAFMLSLKAIMMDGYWLSSLDG